MITFIIGLILGFALAAIPGVYDDTRDRAAPTTAIGLNVVSDITLAPLPGFIHLHDDGGALLHKWPADRYGLIGWTRRPELLIFLAYTAAGRIVVAGAPSDGALYEIAPAPVGWFDYASRPDALVFRTPDGDRLIALPGEIVQPMRTEGYPDAAGAFRVAADGVRRHDELLLEDRGLAFSLLASPSGRWVAALESQPSNSYAIWSIDARGSSPAFERLVDYAELPLAYAEGNPLSPNRRWVVTTGTVQTILRRADGLVKILPVGSSGSPLWREDSAAFLLNSTIGEVLVDVPEATMRIVMRGSAPILSWEGGRIRLLTFSSDQ